MRDTSRRGITGIGSLSIRERCQSGKVGGGLPMALASAGSGPVKRLHGVASSIAGSELKCNSIPLG